MIITKTLAYDNVDKKYWILTGYTLNHHDHGQIQLPQ